jgi:hypothetical protein
VTQPDRLYGYAAIAAVLSEAWGERVSEDGAYRLAVRSLRPLPVDGYAGRVWASRAAVLAWVEDERRRRGRTPANDDRQGDLWKPR